jgi:hypothetical protein
VLAVAEIPPQAMQEMAAIVEEAKCLQQENERALLVKLSGKRDAWVRAKRPIEERMIDDLRQYEGMTRQSNTKQFPFDAAGDTKASPPRIHATRIRTDMIEARIADMLVPTNDESQWTLTPTEEPDIAGVDPKTTPEELDKLAEQACGRMAAVIKDQLTECKFSSSIRAMIRDACRTGSGLIMGPMNAIRFKRRFTEELGVMQVTIEESPVPEIRYGNPWFFYPEMVESAEKAQGAFYLHLMSQVELSDFVKLPNVRTDAITALLQTEPDLGEVGTNIRTRNDRLPFKEAVSDRWAVWRYTGVMDRDELECLGLQLGEGPMPMVDLWFCQDYVLKCKFRPIQGDFRIPYYVYSPFPADDTMFGYSVPYMCRDSQRVVDASYQIALHNASVSAGPVVFARSKAFPKPKAGESYEINGPKLFWVNDNEQRLDDIVKVVLIENNVEQAMALMDRALQLLDDEIGLFNWVNNEVNKAVQTSSGLAMLMNAQSILQRRAAAAFDDQVVPVIERMYWWNMLYNKRRDIKGDYKCVANGQSQLLVKDIKANRMQVFMQTLAANPRYQPYLDAYEELMIMAQLMDVPKDRLVIDREKAEANMPQPPPDPRVEVEKIRADVVLKQIEWEREKETMRSRTELLLAEGKSLEAEAAMAAQTVQKQDDNDTKLRLEDLRQRTKAYSEMLKDSRERSALAAHVTLEAEKLASKEAADRLEVQVEQPARLA